jgi:N-acetylmuramoyl-L-alanine amidase
VDVGHYYAAPGATAASGKAELEFNQELAYEVRQVRPELMPDAEFFSGFSLFVSRLNPQLGKSVACASAIGVQMRSAGLAPSRYHADPVFGESRPYADQTNGVHFFDNLAVARTATVPAVLVEAGVIVSPREERELREPRLRWRIAAAIAQGVENCLR